MTRPGRASPLREARLFVSGPPSAILDRFEAALRRAGSFCIVRGPWSIAASPDLITSTDRSASPTEIWVRDVVAGARSPGPGTIPVGGAQLALVPVQADPGMVRAWLTWVPGSNPTQDPVQVAVDAFALGERDGSRANKVAIERREGARDPEAAWVSQASNIRHALRSTGLPDEEVDARVAFLRGRWIETRRSAGAITEDEPPSV